MCLYQRGDSRTLPIVYYKIRYMLAMAGTSVVCTTGGSTQRVLLLSQSILMVNCVYSEISSNKGQR